MKTFNLTKVIFLLFSFFSSSVSPLKAAEQTLDEELLSMDIHEENAYPYVENSNQEVSTLLFLENDAEYYIYFYLPKGIVQYDFLTIQLGICVSDSFDDLNSDSNLEVNNYTLEYVDTTNNGCVAKYAILDMEDTLHTYDHRRYSIRQVYMRYDNVLNPPGTIRSVYMPYWQTLGDEYYYYQDLNGQTAYQYKKAEFVSLTYKEVYSYYFNTVNPVLEFIGVNRGQEHYFYGFTPDRDIDHLTEVEIIYDYYSIEAYKAQHTSKYYQPLPGATENDLKYKPIFGETKRGEVIVLEGEVNVEISPDFLFWKAKTMTWNRISTYEELSNNEDSTFANFVKTHFSDAQFIVNFAGFDYSFSEHELPVNFINDYLDFCSYLAANGAEIGSSIPMGEVYRFYGFKGTYVSNVQMIRMCYETDGIQYNIQVITDPIDSSGSGEGVDNPELKDWVNTVITIFKFIIVIIFIVLIVYILKFIWKFLKLIFNFLFGRNK